MERVLGAGLAEVLGWERYAWLRAGFSTRLGGVSRVYGAGGLGESGELNLGRTKEDTAAAITENRRLLVEAVGGGAGMELVTVAQVHGAVAHRVRRGEGALTTEDGRAVLRGDGLMTDEVGLLLGVQTADCVPVLVVDTRLRAVAAFHAGWRGTVGRIVERGVGTMREEFRSEPEDLVAAVGPSIGPCCFAVGQEVREEFAREFGYGEELFREMDGVLYGDLWEANRRQLAAAGVGEVKVVGECSVCTRMEGRRKYFSYRGEKGVTGRMMGVVGVVGE
jgi:YfiH family protein